MKYSVPLFFVALIVDQFSKFIVQKQSGIILNDGVSFGLFSFVSPVILHIASLLLIVVLTWQFLDYWKKHLLAASLFFAGAFSNSLDRIWWGGVRDWLPIPGFALHNNLADWYIAISLIYLALFEIRKKYE
jgi:lipoprotein signal peptidase